MADPLLTVENLSVEYLGRDSAVRVVDDVSFEIGRGEVLGLAGESGSGKSTIAQALLRILAPPAAITGGSVRFDSRDVLAMNESELRAFRWRKASLVFQSAMNALNPVTTVGEQIADVMLAHGEERGRGAKDRALDRAAALLDLVGIERTRLSAYPHELSGGMRQRVVIAIALSLKPPLIIMDEPTTALDVVVQKEILREISELKERLGFSILFITHDLSLMVEVSTRIAILYAGRLVETAPARELFERPKHPYTRGLLEAFPSLHGPKKKLTGIPGSPPDLRSPPPGCRFHPRCPDVLDRCPKETPLRRPLDELRTVACHLYQSGGAS